MYHQFSHTDPNILSAFSSCACRRFIAPPDINLILFIPIISPNIATMAKSCVNPGCTAVGTKTCARCRQSSYCSKLCQKENWAQHKKSCNPAPGTNDAKNEQEPIQCVKIYGNADGGGRYEDVHLPFSHKIFQSTPLPISLKFGYPLVMDVIIPHLPRGQETDNQHATWLMIDPVTGFAPPAWQGGIGSVHVARPDRAPLTSDTLAAITDYVSDILDAFGERNPRPIVQRYFDRARLDRYFVSHRKMQSDYQDALKNLYANGDRFANVIR